MQYIVLLVIGIYLLTIPSAAQSQCTGPYKGKTPTGHQFRLMLEQHEKWLASSDNGERANLCEADLSQARGLFQTNLRKANLRKVNLSGAELNEVDLREADLSDANLQWTNIFNTNLDNSQMWDVDLAFAVYEPDPRYLPIVDSLARAKNLDKVTFLNSPQALEKIRKIFKEMGLYQQERNVTYAIKRTYRCMNLAIFCPIEIGTKKDTAGFFKKIDGLFNLIFFELTCAYGMRPGRPLLILFCLIPIFSILYVISLKKPGKHSGIWVTRIADNVYKGIRKEKRFRIRTQSVKKRQLMCLLRVLRMDQHPEIFLHIMSWLRTFRVGFYFSILSAFHVGWRELSIGNWITRLQSRHYILSASGWVRTVSGIQSLIGVYLLALWVLTYFGRLFD